jgi:hypothetical protein
MYRSFIAALSRGYLVKMSLPAGEYEVNGSRCTKKLSIFRAPGTSSHITRRMVWAPLGMATRKWIHQTVNPFSSRSAQ